MKVYDGSTQSEQAEEAEPERVKVGIAEYDVTTDGAVLTTSGLGSCIGVALHDPETGVSGLVHVMLPSADEMDDGNAAKFADTGTELLVEELEAAGASTRRIEAKIAGGSDMLDFSESGTGIGVRNAEQVRETLSEYGIPIVGEDVGGDHGRSLRLESRTGDLVVKSANQEDSRL
ncbi:MULTISPECIES: chemotaxis protein CheD [Salinibaculum]|uniref:chemotaxis protein CheD n=1 Tax=Salinibaculum TaxID=2732368 RepID=UPI0030D38D11